MGGNNRKTGLVLQERDRRLLQELAIMGLTDRELAKNAAGFRSTTRANTRLLKLTRAGLLHRFFVGTIAGGRKAIYTLSKRGGALTGMQYRRISRSHGKTIVGDLYVDHQLRINEIYSTVKFESRPTGVQFVRWLAMYQAITANTRLVPDGYFELASNGSLRPMFLEVDLGHQAMKVWQQKVRAYLQLAISGDFAAVFHQSQFRVLVITTSPRRLAKIRSVVAKQTDKIFWLSDFQTINRAGFWSRVWHRPTGEQPLSLI